MQRIIYIAFFWAMVCLSFGVMASEGVSDGPNKEQDIRGLPPTLVPLIIFDAKVQEFLRDNVKKTTIPKGEYKSEDKKIIAPLVDTELLYILEEFGFCLEDIKCMSYKLTKPGKSLTEFSAVMKTIKEELLEKIPATQHESCTASLDEYYL